MEDQSSPLNKFLLELLDPATSPVKALESLSSSWLSPVAYSTEDDKPVVIFLACMRFMMTRLPDACVDGIWENILKNTVKFTRNFPYKAEGVPEKTHIALDEFARANTFVNAPELCGKFIPIKNLRVRSWLIESLSNHSKCCNPYRRLELFHLFRLFRVYMSMSPDDSREKLSTTLIHTICEIQPHHLFPTNNDDNVIFGPLDLEFIMKVCSRNGILQQIISNDLIKQFNKRNEVSFSSEETKFLVHCLEIIGIFAIMAGSNTNHKIQPPEAWLCLELLRRDVGLLVKCGNHLPGMSDWKQFCYIFSNPPFRCYAIEAIRHITAAVNNTNNRQLMEDMMSIRDSIVKNLDICTKTCDLPKLMLSCQTNGPMVVHQHSLLLRRLTQDKDNPTRDPYSQYGNTLCYFYNQNEY